MRYDKSLAMLERGLKVIPLATQTFSKGYKYFPKGAWPVYLDHGIGAHVWDVDGNGYIDFICSLGPVTLGYHYPAVDKAIKRQLNKGIIFSLPSPLEVELAEKLTTIIPCAEMVRFLKTGSESTQAAIRIARYYTGKNHIAYFGYHGWHEFYAVISERPGGIPKEYGQYMHQFEYNNIDSLEKILEQYQCAAVIMEPQVIEPPKPNFLFQVRELAHKYGALLIFDEVVTGFRLHSGGAQAYYNTTPDLCTLGKGMANGMPIAAVAGKKKYMDSVEDIFVSSTFGGECLSLAASLATINEMERTGSIGHTRAMAHRMIKGLNDIGIQTIGNFRPMIASPLNDRDKSVFLQLLAEHGVLIHSGLVMNFSYSHTMDIVDATLNIIEDCWKKISTTEQKGDITYAAFKRV